MRNSVSPRLSRHFFKRSQALVRLGISGRWTMAQQSRSKLLKDDPPGSNTWNQDESLAMIAHEIRNTSQIILSWAELLCRRAPSDEAMLQGFEVIRRNGRLQARLLN